MENSKCIEKVEGISYWIFMYIHLTSTLSNPVCSLYSYSLSSFTGLVFHQMSYIMFYLVKCLALKFKEFLES